MKNCKRRTIFSWIFAFILLIPMFTIAVRCLYVVINKNAYQSYSDTISVETQYRTNDVNTINDLVEGNVYTFTNPQENLDIARLGIQGILTNNNIASYDFTQISTQYDTTIRTNYTYNGTTYKTFTIIPNNETFNFYTTVNSIDFIYGNTQFNSNIGTMLPYITRCDNLPIELVTNPNGFADNVFEYSIQQFVDKHGNGLINFFGLLEQYFMQSTSANALYFTFANWCLNYALLVSCVWLLFSVLMWFINYCNYMLNTSFRKGHGD